MKSIFYHKKKLNHSAWISLLLAVSVFLAIVIGSSLIAYMFVQGFMK